MQNDIAPLVLDRLLDETPHPERLQELVVLSRQLFGWFTKHEARSFEYPWMAEQCAAVGPRSVVDIGAGLSPLPVWLARLGAEVTTIDYHPTCVELDHISDANEWGFLDYASFDHRCRSLNADASAVELTDVADVVLSVSVIEHMPADVRRAVVAKAASWQRTGGSLLLTVDVVPDSDALWNLDRGETVEPPEEHGTFEEMVAEVEGSGYRIGAAWVHRWAAPNRPADIGFISAVRS